MSISEQPGKPKIQFQLYREIFQPINPNVDPNNNIECFKMYINIKTVEDDPKERSNKKDAK